MNVLTKKPEIFLAFVCIGLLLGTLFFHLCLRKKKLSSAAAWLGLLLGTALAAILAKAGYLVFNLEEQFGLYGIGALIRTKPESFCFVTGGVGYVLGVVLAARILKQPRAEVLDCFAAAGCLIVACIRFGELWLGEFGLGELNTFGFPYIEDGSFAAFFPLSVKNAWDEWWLAICTLETLAALAAMIYALLIRCKRPGLRFQRTVFLLCACQFVLELTRSVSLIFFFVHVEQVFCALIMLGLIIHAGILYRHLKGKQPVWAYILFFLCLLVNGLAQYALDKPYKFSDTEWFSEHVGPICLACYLVTAVGLCLIYRALWHPADSDYDANNGGITK